MFLNYLLSPAIGSIKIIILIHLERKIAICTIGYIILAIAVPKAIKAPNDPLFISCQNMYTYIKKDRKRVAEKEQGFPTCTVVAKVSDD